MITKDFNITNPTGLHTRPANRFVKEAKKYNSAITIRKNEKEANAKSLLKILKLGISQGDVVIMTFDGPDEQAACDGMSSLIQCLEE